MWVSDLALADRACHLPSMVLPQLEDERYMRRALALAARGIGTTHPNPRVGAVIVKDDKIVGEGWHERPGKAHAEVVALEQAGSHARGATLYVNLEPCAGHGRTPPCTEAIINAGIKRLVYASTDPHPVMAGGAKLLRQHGLDIAGGVLADRADELNRPFQHFIRYGRPYVTAKAAISLDGKLATHQQHSQWISSMTSRRHAHRLRAASDAILVGCGTLIKDNPSLTVRHVRRHGEPPLRAVACFDVPAFSGAYRIADGSAPGRLYVQAMNKHAAAWNRAGVEVVKVSGLLGLLEHLANEGRLALLVEGGGKLHAALFEAGLSDELVLYQAPILVGGAQATGLWQGHGVARIDEAVQLAQVRYRRLGPDQLIRGRLVYHR